MFAIGRSAAVVFLVGAALLGCRGQTQPKASPDGGPMVVIPDPPDDSCAGYEFTFAPSCGESCRDTECSCPDGPRTAFGMCVLPTQPGCLAGLNCAAACRTTQMQLLNCQALPPQPCAVDADCPTMNRCVVAAGRSRGECGSGVTGARCREPADCIGGLCVAVKPDGTRQCTDAQVRSGCNDNAQCDSRRCALPDGSFLGVCTGGQEHDPCFRASDCDPGLRCIELASDGPKECTKGLDGSPCKTVDDCLDGRKCVLEVDDLAQPRTCSSGIAGSNCGFDTDCASGICYLSKCSDGLKGTGCSLSGQCKSGFCNAGLCGDGALGDPCTGDEACQSHKCSGGVGYPGVCTDGADGHACRRGDQCGSGICGHVCTRGRAGDPCSIDADCKGGTCPTNMPDPLVSVCAAHNPSLTLTPCANDGYCIITTCYHFRCIGGEGADAGN